MTTKVMNKKEFEKLDKKYDKEIDEIDEWLKKKDYILTVYQTGDKNMSLGDYEREVTPNRFYVVCSLEEIPEYIQYMKQPFWGCPKGFIEKGN